MSDDTPTERFTAPTAPTPVPADDEPRSRTLLYVLIGVGAALLIAIIILLIVLATRQAPEPEETLTAPTSPSPTPTVTSPSPTPTVEETEDAPPPTDDDDEPEAQGPITSFTVDDTTVDCDGKSSVTVHFAWKADGLGLWFGVGVNDAEAAPYAQYELEDELDFDYQCGQSSGQQKYTITVKSSDGVKTSQSIIIKE